MQLHNFHIIIADDDAAIRTVISHFLTKQGYQVTGTGSAASLWRMVVPPKDKPKKKFSRKNKLIVRVKSRWGLIGLALITPTIISIPVGTLLAARYFGNNWRTLPYMLLSVVGWGFVATIGWDFIVPVVKGWFA